MALESASTAKERGAVAKGLKQAAALDNTLPYFHKDAGLAVTWRQDRGFGLVMLARADSHNAALHAAKTVAAAVKQMGIPMQQGGSSWAAVIPGMDMMVPSNVPVKLAPFVSAKDDWLVIGSHPTWTASTAAPSLRIPASATGAQFVSVLSMRWLPAIYTLIEKNTPADDTDTLQGLALAKGLHLETSLWSSAGRIDPAGRWSSAVGEVTNWDWRAALDNTVAAIQNWKPTPKNPKGHDLLPHAPETSSADKAAPGI
jgi:hypothetical protein